MRSRAIKPIDDSPQNPPSDEGRTEEVGGKRKRDGRRTDACNLRKIYNVVAMGCEESISEDDV